MKRAIPRVGLAVLFSAILAVAAVLPAAADGPIYRAPSEDSSGLVDWFCAFPVQFTVVELSKTDTVWLRDGTYVVHSTGGGVFTWANTVTGTTIVTRLHGDVEQFYNPDGSYTLIWNGNHMVPNLSILARGHTELHYGPGDVLLSASTTGNHESLCAALGG